MGGKVLGLDLGTASIGFALIEHDNYGEPECIISTGVRRFEEVVDLKSRVPKNQARRAARSSRRTLARRRMRRERMIEVLVQAGLLPQTQEERLELFRATDPYELRKKALDSKLKNYELGRVFYHLSQRRGFQSNRKAKKEEERGLLEQISILRRQIADGGFRTLGEYQASMPEKRRLHTERAMYNHEFAFIWSTQQTFNALLTPELKISVHKVIFHQRPLKVQKFLVGKCSFEPSKRRAARAVLEAQRFRMLQDVNNLAVKNPVTRAYRPLSSEERAKLLALLEKSKNVGWKRARRILKLHEGEVFNLEEGGKDELAGDRTSHAIRSVVGAGWDELPFEKKTALVTDMLTIDNEAGFLNRMKSHWGFSESAAEKLATIELEPGYTRLSRKAITNILTFLEQGLTYDKAASEAGYNHSSPGEKSSLDSLREPPDIRNPVVKKALHETRKVVNAVIRRFGKPGLIRIEMARDMKLTKRQKEKLIKEQNVRKKENERARNILNGEFGIQNPTHEDILKYKLWTECGMVCPYTGTSISRQMLFSSDVDVEHILPYSRTLDDSYMNKTLCIATENRGVKKGHTPFEAYGGDQEKYESILQRVRALPYPKMRKFETKELDTGEFISRQLNDTRYICVEVKKYLEGLGVQIEVGRGDITAALRRCWRLNAILAPDGDNEKFRGDHRHHAIDALVAALTTRSFFTKVAVNSCRSADLAPGQRGFTLDTPWPGFLNDAASAVEGIVVSHAHTRRLSGALHEETAFGYDEREDVFVYRKPLNLLTPKMLEQIRDAKVKGLILKRLEDFDGDLKKAFTEPLLHLDGKTQIKSVRIGVKCNHSSVQPVCDRSGGKYKFFQLGNNHHVEIIEDVSTGKRKGIFVTTLEAARRARIEKSCVVRRDHGPGWKFVMSLCANDMFEAEIDGVKKIYRVQKMSGPINQIVLREHWVSDSSSAGPGILRATPNTLRGRKIGVDCLGSIYPCND
ncbi:CRISPR-associated endonuclease Cas9 [uncultured bacterium]|nr:CRISPR-associated endonuclease Cas9 [uncultured bacterium]